MSFFVETHMHTAQVSPCGHVPAAEGVAQYLQAGYDAVIITDHLRDDIMDGFEGTWIQKTDRWLEGYRLARQAAEGTRLQVWLGLELTLSGTQDDFLFYGIDEQFIYDRPQIYALSLADLHRAASQKGALLAQAHPFRPYVRVADPRYLDGMEIMNGNPRQQNNNDKAAAFCQRYGLLATGGSDYHQPQDLSVAMAFERPLECLRDFVEAVKRREGRVVETAANPPGKRTSGRAG